MENWVLIEKKSAMEEGAWVYLVYDNWELFFNSVTVIEIQAEIVYRFSLVPGVFKCGV